MFRGGNLNLDDKWYKKFFLNWTIVQIILFIIVLKLFNSNSRIEYLNIFFEHIKNGTLYITIDKQFKDFIKGNGVDFINNSINLLNETLIFLIVILILYYLIYGFVIYMGKFTKYKSGLYFMFLYLMKHRFKFKKDNILGYISVFLMVSAPFIIWSFRFDNSDAWLLLIMSFIIIYIIYEKISYLRVLTIVIINLLICVTVDLFIMHHNFIYDGYKSLVLVLDLLLSTYAVVALTLLLVYIFMNLVTIEYSIAAISKKYSLFKISQINVCDNKEEFENYVNKAIEERKGVYKYERINKRKEILYKRNLENLLISIYLATFIYALINITILFWLVNLKGILITAFLFVFIRFLTRSYEVVIAFFKDATSTEAKLSSLTYIDRIKLIIKSLIEMTIYSTILKLLYYSVHNGFLISTVTIRNTIDLFFESFSLQLFNISFSEEYGLIFGSIHVVQILISGCLILLCLALYSGRTVSTTMNYIIYKKGKYYLYQKISGDHQSQTKELLNFHSIGKLNEMWVNNEIENHLYDMAVQEYKIYHDWIKENDLLKKELLSLKE